MGLGLLTDSERKSSTHDLMRHKKARGKKILRPEGFFLIACLGVSLWKQKSALTFWKIPVL